MEKTNPLYVPLDFWYCQNPGLALPKIALQCHDVKIDLDIRKDWHKLREYNNFDIKCDKKININDNFINLSEYLSHWFEE